MTDLIEPGDRGFTLGDGLFETLLCEDGVVYHAAAHWARMSAGCQALGLAAPDWGAIATPKMTMPGRMALRASWSAGVGGRGLDRGAALRGKMSFLVMPAPPPPPARLITARGVRRNEHSPASRWKTLSYLDNVLARREAAGAGGDEAVMLNTAGNLACAAAANLFWIKDGEVFTPALDCGVLAGVTRARLMEKRTVREVVAGPEALERAEAVFLTNSLSGVRAVASLDGRRFEPHAQVAALAAALAP